MTIEVFKFLNERISKLDQNRETNRPNNTVSTGISGNKTKNRKRSAEDFILSDHPGNKVHIPNPVNQALIYFPILSDNCPLSRNMIDFDIGNVNRLKVH